MKELAILALGSFLANYKDTRTISTRNKTALIALIVTTSCAVFIAAAIFIYGACVWGW